MAATRSDGQGAAPRRLAVGALAAALLGVAALVWSTWPVFARPASGLYTGAPAPDLPAVRLLADRRPEAPAPADGTPWAVLASLDTLRSVWTLAWWSHAVRDPPARSWLDANILYPAPKALTYADLQLGAVPWFAPTWWLSGSPVLAYNLALLASTAAGSAAFFLLLRGWTGSSVAGLVAAVAAAAAPYRLDQLELLYLFAIPYLPATLLAVDAVLAGRRPGLAAAVVLAGLVLQSSSSAYLAYAAFLLVGTYALVALLEERTAGAWARAGWLVAAAVVAAVCVGLLYRPFAEHVGGLLPTEGPAATERSIILFRAWDMPVANLHKHFVEGAGVPVIVLAAFGVLHRRSRRRWTALAVTALGAVLALGPETRIGSVTIGPLPWEWLSALVPGFAAQRHRALTMVTVGVGMTCLAGLGAGWLADRARRGPAWSAVAALVVGIAAWGHRSPATPSVLPVRPSDDLPAAYRWLAERGAGEPLLELPAAPLPDAVYAYFSAFHWLPLFNGTFSIEPPGYTDRAAAAWSVLDPAAAPAFLRAVPVRWILVHGDLAPPAQRARLAVAPPHLDQVGRFGADLLYRVRDR